MSAGLSESELAMNVKLIALRPGLRASSASRSLIEVERVVGASHEVALHAAARRDRQARLLVDEPPDDLGTPSARVGVQRRDHVRPHPHVERKRDIRNQNCFAVNCVSSSKTMHA